MTCEVRTCKMCQCIWSWCRLRHTLDLPAELVGCYFTRAELRPKRPACYCSSADNGLQLGEDMAPHCMRSLAQLQQLAAHLEKESLLLM